MFFIKKIINLLKRIQPVMWHVQLCFVAGYGMTNQHLWAMILLKLIENTKNGKYFRISNSISKNVRFDCVLPLPCLLKNLKWCYLTTNPQIIKQIIHKPQDNTEHDLVGSINIYNKKQPIQLNEKSKKQTLNRKNEKVRKIQKTVNIIKCQEHKKLNYWFTWNESRKEGWFSL